MYVLCVIHCSCASVIAKIKDLQPCTCSLLVQSGTSRARLPRDAVAFCAAQSAAQKATKKGRAARSCRFAPSRALSQTMLITCKAVIRISDHSCRHMGYRSLLPLLTYWSAVSPVVSFPALFPSCVLLVCVLNKCFGPEKGLWLSLFWQFTLSWCTW